MEVIKDKKLITIGKRNSNYGDKYWVELSEELTEDQLAEIILELVNHLQSSQTRFGAVYYLSDIVRRFVKGFKKS